MTTVTIRIDQTLKSELQRLLSDLGMDTRPTFFTIAAKTGSKGTGIAFLPNMNQEQLWIKCI